LLLFHVYVYIIVAVTHVPMLLTVCKTHTKNYYDNNGEIKEKTTLVLYFTIDYRFIDPYTLENVNKDVDMVFNILD
jgi:hypothetical protein